MRSLCLAISCFLIILVSCDSSLEFEKRNFEELFSMDVEKSMSELQDSDPFAATEYGNEFKEFYFKVIHTPVIDYQAANFLQDMQGEELLAFYLQDIESDIATFMDRPEILSITPGVINNLACVQYKIKTYGNNHPIIYYIGYFLSDKEIYQLHIWTMETRHERLKDGISRMMNSFQEI